MKTLFSILIASSLWSPFINNKEINGYDEFVVTPGVGFPELKIGALSPKRKLNFREVEFEERDGKSIVCGDKTYRSYWKTFYNKDLGLTFEFNSKYYRAGTIFPSKKMYLTSITLSSIGCSTDDICIGVSTFKDVIKKYGSLPKHRDKTSFLKFAEKGIAFRFDNKSTLIEVEIFRPKIE